VRQYGRGSRHHTAAEGQPLAAVHRSASSCTVEPQIFTLFTADAIC
jgi:hypothetical protein